MKKYLSRHETRRSSVDHPVGDPFGGAAYGGKADPVSAYLQYEAADKAAGAQIKGTKKSNALQKYMYDTSREDLSPYREAGTDALSKMRAILSGDMSGFQASPGYQFNMNEMTKALQNNAAARGNLFSGDFAKQLQNRASGLASNEFSNYWHMLTGMSNQGMGATNQGVQLGQNYAQNVGQGYQDIGNAKGSSYIAKGNAITDFLNNAEKMGLYAMGGGFGG